MKHYIKIVAQKSFLLIKQLAALMKALFKGIVLPGRRRNGNLLTSILILFLDLTTLLIQFPWDFSLKFIKRWKYYNRFNYWFRRGLLITGCFLFLISSIEWSYAKEPNETTLVSYFEPHSNVCNSLIETSETRTIQSAPQYFSADAFIVDNHLYSCYRPSAVYLYLLYQNFRI